MGGNFNLIKRITDLKENIGSFSSDQLRTLIYLLNSPYVYKKCHEEMGSDDHNEWQIITAVLSAVTNDRKSKKR